MRRIAVDNAHVHRLRDGAVMVESAQAVFDIRGPGVVPCLQGLLTNDVVTPGEHSVVYGAVLTPKGMIVADLWSCRLPERFVLVGELVGRSALAELLRRSLPPRLARATDRTAELGALWLYGDLAIVALAAAEFSVPDGEGKVAVQGGGKGELLIVRPHQAAPFRAVLVGAPSQLERAAAALERTGALQGTETDRELARILAGWPLLGGEIGDRTLPQEVRYDDIGGVSYTKGCYTGQETVARLHFRGHTNRELRGLRWDGRPPLDADHVSGADGRDVGTLHSILDLEGVSLGLATVRREIAPGSAVLAAGRTARVVKLPFDKVTPAR